MQRGSTMLKGSTLPKGGPAERDDAWVHSFCDMCLGRCGVMAHRVNGVVVDIKGDPDCPNSLGKLCAKGHSALMGLYNPNRLKTPLKRTNPEKGLGIDPGWVPISWNEAMDILEKELTKIRKEDPRKLTMTIFGGTTFARAWANAFGTPNYPWQGYFCGNYLHAAMYLTNATDHSNFDVEHCNYVILFGNQSGFGVGLVPNMTTQKMAKARARGMKVVVVDPYCNNAGSKADEWVPIRPGTDGALVLSLVNVLLNELGIYDREFIKRYTNGPYLVKPDGYYARREGKPMVWDSKEGIAKTYDAEVKDYAIEAIEGSYLVDGVECLPSFQLLKEHVKKYTPEKVEEITTIPAATIRHIAEEWGREARIGSTIVIEGKEFPYRPVATNIYRGAGGHKHGVSVALAVQLLNQITGNFYTPGGHIGQNLIGPSWSWEPREIDGLALTPAALASEQGDFYNFEVGPPETQGLKELFPLTTNWAPINLLTAADPEKYKLSFKPEVLIVGRRNLVQSGVNHNITAEALKEYRFICFFGLQLEEVSDLADLALPDTHYLETTSFNAADHGWPKDTIIGHWYWGVQEAVVPPVGEARDWGEVLLELAERIGFLGSFYELWNKQLKEPYKLDPKKKYSTEELYDRQAKSKFGEDKGLEWFKENGTLSVKMTVDEIYPLPWLKVRFPIYYENMLRAGKEVAEVTQSLGLKDWDVSDYEALAEWKPCPAYEEKSERDLFAFNFRVPMHSFSWTAENAWLSEIGQFNPYAQKIIINTETAKRKGVKDKDRVYVESAVGKVVGTAKVTECVHPEAVGISGHFGSLFKGKPIAYGKGANFNNLLPFGEKWIDPVSAGVDSCVRVKVYKA